MSEPKILLVAVNYNQHSEIEKFLAPLPKVWPLDHAVLVDDGSVDDSPKIAESHGLKVLRHEKNRGVGAAIRTGIQYAETHQYDAVIVMASNGKMRPEEISRLSTPIRTNQADYVCGNRFLNGGNSEGLSPFRRLAIPFVSLILSVFLRKYFSDLTCGFRAYRLDFLKDPKLDISQKWLDRYELEYYVQYWACRLKLRIVQVPVTMTYEHLAPGRISKIKPITGWWSMLRPILLLSLGVKK